MASHTARRRVRRTDVVGPRPRRVISVDNARVAARPGVPIVAQRQPTMVGELPIRFGAPGPRVAAVRQPAGRVGGAVVASALLHAAVLTLLVVVIGAVLPPAPPEVSTISLVFQPAETAAPAPVQPAEPVTPAPEQSSVSPPLPEPAEPPAEPEQAMAPPQEAQPPSEPAPPEPSPTAEPMPLPPPLPPPHPIARPRPPPAAQPRPRPAEPPAAPAPLPAPAPAAAPPVAAAPAAPSPAWRLALSRWLASHRTYPEEARRRSEEGSVTVRFTVEPTGQVTAVTVLHGSGSSRLDAAAEALLRDARLPPFDPAMQPVPVTFTVQIQYTLTQ